MIPANENPWYWLATLYGEQKSLAASRWSFDFGLAAKNRVAWNRWMAGSLTESQQAKLISYGFDPSELIPLSSDEKNSFLKQFITRSGRTDTTPPYPEQSAEFTNVVFESLVCFSGFVFRGAHFQQSRFCRHAEFNKAVFLDYAGFRQASFAETTSFEKTCFGGYIIFGGTIFSQIADFKNANFESYTMFSQAKFKKSPPDFRGAQLCAATEWDGSIWPPLPSNRADCQEHIFAYEYLKADMERLKKHADEQFFFAQELRARRALEPIWSPEWHLNFAYLIFSGYGQSVGRPILWIFILWVVAAYIFSLTPTYRDAPLPFDQATALSITNIISLLPFKPDKEVVEHLSASAKLIGNVQAIFGAALLFLLGLGLRNRFRMK